MVLDDIRGSFNVGDPNRKLLRYVFGVSGAISRNAGATQDAGGSLDFVIEKKSLNIVPPLFLVKTMQEQQDPPQREQSYRGIPRHSN